MSWKAHLTSVVQCLHSNGLLVAMFVWLTLEKHGLHFKATLATTEQLAESFINHLVLQMQAIAPGMWNLVLALLDSQDHHCCSMLSSAMLSVTSFLQEEMGLGEFGENEIGEGTDDDDSNVNVFDKHPRKWQ
ncbi:hypothetical protein BS17DRAFT_769139 [Gyrodon lividus]|nr:hypothetical protein BS17DRAFT_769139 [Gyrodon lividus]